VVPLCTVVQTPCLCGENSTILLVAASNECVCNPEGKSDKKPPFGGVAPVLPCENTLPTSSFCHTPDGRVNDAYCTCERAAEEHACGTRVMVDGVAVLDMDLECARFCGRCPAERPPLFPKPCPAAGNTITMPTACHKGGAFPYFCSKASAETSSPSNSAHQDETDGLLWMPNGVSSFHGDYLGAAPLCDCTGSAVSGAASSTVKLGMLAAAFVTTLLC
jgi:hypothetical protein